MARGSSNSPTRSSPAKKKPAKSKRAGATAPARGTRKRTTARKAATTTKRGGKVARKATTKKASKKMGKPKTASTASHKGSSRPPARSPKVSRRRAPVAQAKKDAAAAGGEGGAADTPSGHSPGRIEVRNVNVPGRTSTVDARKYEAMRSTLFSVLPRAMPGLTQSEMLAAVEPKLPQDVFPGGEKAMWWIKTVQLDQEARGAIRRSQTKPLRWWRAA